MIFGVHVTDRMKNAQEVQKLFSEYGQHIRTRLGLHQVYDDRCVPGGIILLEMVGDWARCEELAGKLAGIEGVEAQRMVFHHSHG